MAATTAKERILHALRDLPHDATWDDAIDPLRLAEAKRRRDDVRAGRVQTVPGDEARRKVRDAVAR